MEPLNLFNLNRYADDHVVMKIDKIIEVQAVHGRMLKQILSAQGGMPDLEDVEDVIQKPLTTVQGFQEIDEKMVSESNFRKKMVKKHISYVMWGNLV